jgi:four helix bundle protein
MDGSYRDSRAWQRSWDLVFQVYRSTQSFPKNEMYALTTQMRRAAISISSNIAEGKGRSSDKEFILFLCHARRSVLELETQALIAQKLGYLVKDDEGKIQGLTAEVGKILNTLINSLNHTAA